MNKKLWARCLMAGVLSMSLFVVAGCGDSKEDKQARFEKAHKRRWHRTVPIMWLLQIKYLKQILGKLLLIS